MSEKIPISIVVPAYDSELSIAPCLDAIFENGADGMEVIVVDDASKDNTVAIAKRYDVKVIRCEQNMGAAYARMMGEKHAKNDIILFCDSDVIIGDDTLARVQNALGTDCETVAVVGLFSKEHPNVDFFSNYKNLYMNHIFTRCPQDIDFLFGTVFGIRKGHLRMPKTSKRYGEDTECGMRLVDSGERIILDKKLEVIHMKKYGLLSLLKNDMRISRHFTRIFLANMG